MRASALFVAPNQWVWMRIPLITMGRIPAVAGGRRAVVSTRLSAEEARILDLLRGTIDRSTYLRLLIRAAGKQNGA